MTRSNIYWFDMILEKDNWGERGNYWLRENEPEASIIGTRFYLFFPRCNRVKYNRKRGGWVTFNINKTIIFTIEDNIAC